MKKEVNKPLIQEIREDLFVEKEITVSVLRLDAIHPYISGNKWYKLKYNIEAFSALDKKFLVTIGGAFSNHIIATAAAGKEFGIDTVGIIRGDELGTESNPALKFASSSGMKLFFVSREEYRQLRETEIVPEDICRELNTTPSDIYFLPEGGSNILAVKGCAEIVQSITTTFDFICCAAGTGATVAGISSALENVRFQNSETKQAVGISVLNGENFLEEEILKVNGGRKNFMLIHNYGFGGYAKTSAVLEAFCKKFSMQHSVPIEPVYTGKLFYGLYDLIHKDFFKRGSKIVAVHTGGVFALPAVPLS